MKFSWIWLRQVSVTPYSEAAPDAERNNVENIQKKIRRCKNYLTLSQFMLMDRNKVRLHIALLCGILNHD